MFASEIDVPTSEDYKRRIHDPNVLSRKVSSWNYSCKEADEHKTHDIWTRRFDETKAVTVISYNYCTSNRVWNGKGVVAFEIHRSEYWCD